jgi:hypothetical protein
MILPTTYPSNFLDVMTNGAIKPLAKYFFLPKIHKSLLLLMLVNFLLFCFTSFVYPGNRPCLIELVEPAYLVPCNANVILAIVFFLFYQKFRQMIESPVIRTDIIGMLGIQLLAFRSRVRSLVCLHDLLF